MSALPFGPRRLRQHLSQPSWARAPPQLARPPDDDEAEQ